MRTYLLLGALALFLLCLIVMILSGYWLERLISHPLLAWSAGMLLLAAGVITAIARRYHQITPSAALFAFFLAGPIIGPQGLDIYDKLYHNLSGVNTDMTYPIFIWSVGTLVLTLGILLAHFAFRGPAQTAKAHWSEQRAALMLWLVIGVAATSTLLVLTRVGYVPILHSDIDSVRGTFHQLAGEYPLKFSRLWLAAVPLAALFAFRQETKFLYLVVVVTSCLALALYGQRMYTLIALAMAILVLAKFRRIRPGRSIAFGAGLVVLFLMYAEFRAGRSFKELSTAELATMNAYREWREYTFVVNEIRDSQAYYGEQFYSGALLPVLPKQIWAIFGIDKNKLMAEKSAVYILGDQFGDYLGIRIGTIGEAYAAFGLYHGVCLQMLLFGVLFGWLEVNYIKLDKNDARLSLVIFGLALLIFLPVATMIATLSTAVFFGFFLLLIYFLGSHKLEAVRLSPARAA